LALETSLIQISNHIMP